MTIRVRPYDDLSAMAVLSALDAQDQIEAELTRGAPASALALFADWRQMEPLRVASHVALTAGGQPFAVFALANTGQAGVAQAALLARDHRRHRIDLARLAVLIRHAFPRLAAACGIHRIEARSWAGHPTAARLLAAMGFAHECDMTGFGQSGAITFRQFAWIAPAPAPDPDLPA